MNKKLSIYIVWMIEAIEKIEFHTQGNREKFLDNSTVIDACIMQLIHIGEIMNKIQKIDKIFVLDGIDMKRIIGFRNFAAHDYLGINLGIVKRIIFHDLDILKRVLKKKGEDVKNVS